MFLDTEVRSWIRVKHDRLWEEQNFFCVTAHSIGSFLKTWTGYNYWLSTSGILKYENESLTNKILMPFSLKK